MKKDKSVVVQKVAMLYAGIFHLLILTLIFIRKHFWKTVFQKIPIKSILILDSWSETLTEKFMT